MIKSLKLLVTAKNALNFIDFQLPPLDKNSILAKSLFSGISSATELAVIDGSTPTFSKRWLRKYRCFTFGKPSKEYPSPLGYENIVEVLKIGNRVSDVKIGDILWVDNSHQTFSVVNIEKTSYLKLPGKSFTKKAIFLVPTRVALAGVHDAEPKVGDFALVSGLGVIGLLTVQILKLSGVSKIIASDPIELRRKRAEDFGALTVDPKRKDVALFIHRNLGGVGVDIAIETSGSIKALHDAIRSCSVGGKVVTIATYRSSAKELFLGEEWHRNRIELISSMSVNDCRHRDCPLWNLDRLNKTALNLIVNSKIETETLITHTFPFLEAKKAYALIQNHPEKTIKVILTYEN
jgi:NADPH:quinone reductase-like Zn-dependent oxidoreductase